MVKENYGPVYVQMPDQLWSLDVCKLLQQPRREETPRPRPEFEFMCNYQYHERHPEGPRGRLPFGMKCMMVDSKLHMVGGYWKNMYVNEPAAGWANLDVYACEPIEGDGDGDGDGTPKAEAEAEAESPSPLPSIRLCKSSTIPSLSGPKIDPIVVTLEDKIYVLSQRHRGDVRGYCPALFEVFDPNTRLWNVLPNPPFARCRRFDGLYINHHLACGHKLVVYPFGGDDDCESCIFDTRKRKWEYTDYLERDIGNVNGFAQYRDFLIGVRLSAMCYKRLQLVAYELDSNGIPNLYRYLTERDHMFCNAFGFTKIFEPIFTINVGGDGLMCFIYYGFGGQGGLRLEVGLFRILTDESEKDGWRIYAKREAVVETYFLNHASDGVEHPEIYSAVVSRTLV